MFDERVFDFHDLHCCTPGVLSGKKNRRIIPPFARCAICNRAIKRKSYALYQASSKINNLQQRPRKRLPALLELPRFNSNRKTAWGNRCDRKDLSQL
ncbi:hypothetical protein COO59_12005 [Mixta theicola]|uniref:Uncharacterized protein n=1 Tax=Mixta theicola TaxID=1458355 RepID=A0A2K1Q8I6_9GAMM|nr:hypothetical protein COO59_12005 [Mixta theicola]